MRGCRKRVVSLIGCTLGRCYPSDLTDEEWALLEPLIPARQARRPARQRCPEESTMNAILYVLKNGIPWRAMPHDLPHWSTVYHYFRPWPEGRGVGASGSSPGPPGPGARREPRFPQRPGHGQPVGEDYEKGGPAGNDGGERRSKGESARSSRPRGAASGRSLSTRPMSMPSGRGRALLAGMDPSLVATGAGSFSWTGGTGASRRPGFLPGFGAGGGGRPLRGGTGVVLGAGGGGGAGDSARGVGSSVYLRGGVVERTFAWLGREAWRPAKDYERATLG
jgi:putative transposase